MIAMVVIFRDKIRRSQPSDNRSDNPSHAFFSKALLNRERVRYNRNGAGIFLDYFLPNMSDNINYVVNSKMPSFPTGHPFPFKEGPDKSIWIRFFSINFSLKWIIVTRYIKNVSQHIWVRFPRTGILAKMWSFFLKSRAFVWPNLIIYLWFFNWSWSIVSLGP